MPIQGFSRFLHRNVGSMGTSITSNVAATRIIPYRGSIKVQPNRTQPDVDVGSLDPILAPFLGATEITCSWEGKVAFDDLPTIYDLGIKGGVAASTVSSVSTWTYQAASLTADTFGYITDEWGDDVTTDSIIAGGGVINDFEFNFGEDLAAFDVTANLIYARAEFGTGFTGGLTIDATPNWVYGAHTVVYMDSVVTSIGITPIVDAIHGATFTVNNNLDQKRFANGSNVGFNLAGYGRGPREITLKLVLAKTAATVAEAQTLDDLPVPTRYFDIKTTSTEIVSGSTPYSNSLRFPAYLIGRDDGTISNNDTIELTYRGKYDSTLGYALRAVVVNSRATL